MPDRKAAVDELQALEAATGDIRRRFFEDPWNVSPESELADTLDRFVTSRLQGVTDPSSGYAILAAGGYGRRTLHPFSDLDLLILGTGREFPEAPGVPAVLEDLGFAVGYQIKRTVDFAGFDPAEIGSYTAFFDTRYLSGSAELSERFDRVILPDFIRAHETSLVAAILDERASRVRRFGCAADTAEPDVKNGIGGLRDYHAIHWISRIRALAEPAALSKPVGLLHRIRNFLHYLSGRDDNVLASGHRREIANRLGLGEDRLMREYRRSTQTIAEYLARLVPERLGEQGR